MPAAPGGGGPINEDLIARLRAAEEEVGRSLVCPTLSFSFSASPCFWYRVANCSCTDDFVRLQAQKLKKELAEAQAKMETSSSDQMPPKTAPSSRIDGGDLRRETLDFVGRF